MTKAFPASDTPGERMIEGFLPHSDHVAQQTHETPSHEDSSDWDWPQGREKGGKTADTK